MLREAGKRAPDSDCISVIRSADCIDTEAIVPNWKDRGLYGARTRPVRPTRAGCDFRTGCLTVLPVALTVMRLCADTKSVSSEFRSAHHRHKTSQSRCEVLQESVPRLCPAGLETSAGTADFEYKKWSGARVCGFTR